MAGKFGLAPYRLDDAALERELRHLYATREETFLHGTRQALLNHTERMLQLEREYASRFPERTKADALRTRKGSRIQAGQPAGRSTMRSDHHQGPPGGLGPDGIAEELMRGGHDGDVPHRQRRRAGHAGRPAGPDPRPRRNSHVD